MTTIETRNEHLEQQCSELTAEVSKLQGIVHQQKLTEGQLLQDVRTLQDFRRIDNIEISELQAMTTSTLDG